MSKDFFVHQEHFFSVLSFNTVSDSTLLFIIIMYLFYREGSVIIDFIVHLKGETLEKEASSLSTKIRSVFYSESNTTTEFSQKFPISLSSIAVQPSK